MGRAFYLLTQRVGDSLYNSSSTPLANIVLYKFSFLGFPQGSKVDNIYASEDADPQGRWIVRSHIGWRGERNIL